jgi:hypothetical protein
MVTTPKKISNEELVYLAETLMQTSESYLIMMTYE